MLANRRRRERIKRRFPPHGRYYIRWEEQRKAGIIAKRLLGKSLPYMLNFISALEEAKRLGLVR